MARLLITGGTGSLGRALVGRLLKDPSPYEEIVVLSRDEYKQAQMAEEVNDKRVVFFLGDVRDEPRVRLACQAGIDHVIHAAALKRVDSVARDPEEVFKTNVLGTRNVLHGALEAGVSKLMLVSSDKACQPLNSYGVSKAMAEHLTTSFNIYGRPKGLLTSCVRYGNVLWSRGSVLYTWKKQIESNQAMSITHPEMTRFIITMPEAVSFILGSMEQMKGGEVFVPTLPGALMIDLSRALCEYLGGRDSLPWVVTGLREGGEKLHEVLSIDPLMSSDQARQLSIYELKEKIGETV